MQTEGQTHGRSYTRGQALIIVLVVAIVATIIGNFTSTTTAVSTVSSGPLSITENASCSGFAEPVYYSSMDSDVNYTTYAYGHCLFGFWVSDGVPVGSKSNSAPVLGAG